MLIRSGQTRACSNSYSSFYTYKPLSSQQLIRILPYNLFPPTFIFDPYIVFSCLHYSSKQFYFQTAANKLA